MCRTYLPRFTACGHVDSIFRNDITCANQGLCDYAELDEFERIIISYPGYCYDCMYSPEVRNLVFGGEEDEAIAFETAQRVLSFAAGPGYLHSIFPDVSAPSGQQLVNVYNTRHFSKDVQRPWGREEVFHRIDSYIMRYLMSKVTPDGTINQRALFRTIRKAAVAMNAQQDHLENHRDRYVEGGVDWADSPTLASVPTPEDPTCYVCLEEMHNADKAKEATSLPCGHICCRSCMLTWANQESSFRCPYCRRVHIAVGPDLEDDGVRPWWYHLIISILNDVLEENSTG